MIKRTHQLLLAIFSILCCLPSILFSQNNQDLLRIEPAAVDIQQAWESGNEYKFVFELSSSKGGSFTFETLSFKDDQGMIGEGYSSSISSGGSTDLEAGVSKELTLTISAGELDGSYKSSVKVFYSDPTDTTDQAPITWEIPISLNLFNANQIEVLENDSEITVNTVAKSWLNFLLSTKDRRQGFDIMVKNNGRSPVKIQEFTPKLRGNASGDLLTNNDLYIDTTEGPTVIAANDEKPIAFRFSKKAKVDPDTYSGKILLNLGNGSNPVESGKITINRKMGIVGALFALILGIFVGRMMKDVNKKSSQTQFKLINRFIPMRAQVANLEDKVAKHKLLTQLQELEEEINQVETEEVPPELEAKFPVMSNRVKQIVEWEALTFRVTESLRGTRLKQGNPVHDELVEEVNQARDFILSGKEPELRESLGNIKVRMASIQAAKVKSRSASRSVNSEDGGEIQGISEPKETSGVLLSLEDLNLVLEEEKTKSEDTPTASQPTFGQKFEDFLFKVLNVLTGFKVNARVRYALFRPIAILVATIVLVLLGFREIYISGSATFGMEGIYDYMKLFLWGVVSDVFSRGILGGNLGGNFLESNNIQGFVNSKSEN